jgi:branched-chain amino acid transport system ATP-binding protein
VTVEDGVLVASGLSAGYFGHPFVRNVDIEVRRGEVVALIGPNGAGKTTTLLALAGELPLLGGTVRLDGRPQNGPLYRRARRGLAFVTEERSVFMRMSVLDNLRVGGSDPERAFEIFPILKPLARRLAGLLSGGEQQMLTLARVLTRPVAVVLIDEVSLGLAPLIVERLLHTVKEAVSRQGIGVLLVEQHVEAALSMSDRVYVMRRGSVALSGESLHIADQVRALEESYLSDRVRDATPAPVMPPEAPPA